MSESGNFERETGREVMEKILQELAAKGEAMDALFAHNDDMAIGAIAAMEAAGIRPGKDVVIVSVDGIRDAFTAMIAGKLNASIECNPLLGPQLMKAVKDYMAGKTLPGAPHYFGRRFPRRGRPRRPAVPQVLTAVSPPKSLHSSKSAQNS